MAHQWVPQHNAGAEVMLQAMLRALAARGHHVEVALSRQTGQPYDLDGVHVRPGSDPRDLLDGADVVVCHLENTPAASMLGRWHGKPVVQVLHNNLEITREWVDSGRPALVVANSRWMRQDLADWFGTRPRPPVIVVRPPVDRREYETTPGDRVTLINLRRMESSPGGAVMGKGSEVFWSLAERLPRLRFLGVTGAYGSQDIRLLPNADVIGHVPHDRMRRQVYARTRILLMPSSYESWGRTAVEAMCSGIPVIAHPTPGLSEALGGAGYLIDRDDLDGWAAAIERLQDPDEWIAASLRARDRAAELDPAEDLNRWCESVEGLLSGR